MAPQKSTLQPAASIAAAQAVAILGLLGRKSIAKAIRPPRAAITFRKAAEKAKHSASSIALTKPRAPLVPKRTPEVSIKF